MTTATTSFKTAGCLGVVHVPKAGGTAIRTAVAQLPDSYTGPSYYDAQHFGSERLGASVPEPNGLAIARPDQLAGIVASHRYVMGHYSATSLLQAGCTGLAVQVREPRARVLSLYRYWESQPVSSGHDAWGLWGSELVAEARRPLKDFLVVPSLWPAIESSILRQLLGRGTAPGPQTGVPRFKAFSLSRRYGALRRSMRVVEWSDRSEAFLTRICSVTGIEPVPSLQRENVTEVRSDDQVIDAETLARLDRTVAGDTALLRRLASDGLLARRSDEALDREFHQAAERLGFQLSVPSAAH